MPPRQPISGPLRSGIGEGHLDGRWGERVRAREGVPGAALPGVPGTAALKYAVPLTA